MVHCQQFNLDPDASQSSAPSKYIIFFPSYFYFSSSASNLTVQQLNHSHRSTSTTAQSSIKLIQLLKHHIVNMGAGNSKKWIRNWIDDIPDVKLEGGIRDRGKIFSDRSLRVDCQETLRGPNPQYNIQVQVNKGCVHTTVTLMYPDSVAMCLCPVNDPWSAEQIREALKASVTGHKLQTASCLSSPFLSVDR
jgi:hypothetical protein